MCDPRTGDDDLEPVDLVDETGSRDRRTRSTAAAFTRIRRSLRSRISAVGLVVTALSVAIAIVVTMAWTHHPARRPLARPEQSSTSQTPSTHSLLGVSTSELFAPVVTDNWTVWVQSWTFAAVVQGREAGEGQKWVIIDAMVTNGASRSRLFDAHTLAELRNCDGPDRYRVDPTAERKIGRVIYGTGVTRLREFVFNIPATISRLYLRLPQAEAFLDCA